MCKDIACELGAIRLASWKDERVEGLCEVEVMLVMILRAVKKWGRGRGRFKSLNHQSRSRGEVISG